MIFLYTFSCCRIPDPFHHLSKLRQCHDIGIICKPLSVILYWVHNKAPYPIYYTVVPCPSNVPPIYFFRL